MMSTKLKKRKTTNTKKKQVVKTLILTNNQRITRTALKTILATLALKAQKL